MRVTIEISTVYVLRNGFVCRKRQKRDLLFTYYARKTNRLSLELWHDLFLNSPVVLRGGGRGLLSVVVFVKIFVGYQPLIHYVLHLTSFFQKFALTQDPDFHFCHGNLNPSCARFSSSGSTQPLSK